jgi:hypothetical protein
MHTIPEITAFEADMRAWRHHIHAHPETAFEETATSAFVADKLRSFGLDVHTGLAGTGVVGVLRHGHSPAAVGLRADLDALHIHEKSGVAVRLAERGQDARVRSRRPYDDAARRRARDGATEEFRRDRVFHFPARRGERRRRPGDGGAGTVRALPDASGVRNAQLAGIAGRQDRAARRPADGARTTSSRSSPPAAARTRQCRISAATRCRSPRT